MAHPDGSPTGGLAELEALLAAEAPRMDFLQILRRIECAARDRPRIGEASKPAEEPVRLGQEASLAFAPSAVAGYTPGAPGQPGRLSVSFFGLLGPNGALPLHLTELARERARSHADPTFTRFLDVFHHRMFEFFYRAWAAGQPTVNYDRADRDRFADYVAALIGYLLPSLRGGDGVPDRAKLYYAGWLVSGSRSADGLAAIVGDHLQLPTQVESFVGGWADLPESARWRLGRTPDSAGALGLTTTAGARAWQCAHKFRVVLGPLTRPQFDRMLPGGASLERLKALVSTYAGEHLEWDVRLVLDRSTERPLTLGRGTRLGWDAWLTHRGVGAAGRDDVVFDPLARRPGAAVP